MHETNADVPNSTIHLLKRNIFYGVHFSASGLGFLIFTFSSKYIGPSTWESSRGKRTDLTVGMALHTPHLLLSISNFQQPVKLYSNPPTEKHHVESCATTVSFVLFYILIVLKTVTLIGYCLNVCQSKGRGQAEFLCFQIENERIHH